jgi:hypothetical protein
MHGGLEMDDPVWNPTVHEGTQTPRPSRCQPMEIQIGDRFTDEEGEGEVVSHPAIAPWREEPACAC